MDEPTFVGALRKIAFLSEEMEQSDEKCQKLRDQCAQLEHQLNLMEDEVLLPFPPMQSLLNGCYSIAEV